MSAEELEKLTNAELVRLMAEIEQLRKQIALILSKRVHGK